jgi:hypothetical protein
LQLELAENSHHGATRPNLSLAATVFVERLQPLSNGETLALLEPSEFTGVISSNVQADLTFRGPMVQHRSFGRIESRIRAR